jgi:carbonic anhydrase
MPGILPIYRHLMMTLHRRRSPPPRRAGTARWACAAAWCCVVTVTWAQTPNANPAASRPAVPASAAAATGREGVGAQIVDAIQSANGKTQRATLVTGSADGPRIELPPPPARPAVRPTTRPQVRPPASAASESGGASGSTSGSASAQATTSAPRPSVAPSVVRAPGAIANPRDAAVLRANTRTAAAPDVPWGYSGAGAPANWARLRPDYELCGQGLRQSPIDIDRSSTLIGPAEPLGLAYVPSSGHVIHTGHTIAVDVSGDNTLSVRGTVFRLQQVQFRHPAEVRVDRQAAPMAAHLMHRSDDGRMAVLVVPLEPGEANGAIEQVWTHMPLDINDRVRLPANSLKLEDLLPKDPRYFQFLGSLSTPPCTEGVLWLVFKQASTLSREQLRLFSQLFPNNARPVQPLNGRPVREAR